MSEIHKSDVSDNNSKGSYDPDKRIDVNQSNSSRKVAGYDPDKRIGTDKSIGTPSFAERMEAVNERNESEKAHIEKDDDGNVYSIDGKLQPNITYKLNGNIYKTDDNGRIIYSDEKPQRSPDNPRDNDAQAKVGGTDRRPGDQGGHIVGRDLNGDGGVGNLVAMDSRINQSDYKMMENDIKSDLDKGKDVRVQNEFNYSGNSERPDSFTATVKSDGKTTVYKFDNNLDGSLKNEVPQNGKDIVQAKLNDTNGQISSIKEKYDEKGNLIDTTVRITYKGENGENYRTKVVIDK